ncbi:sugar porter family MFS transporter [Sphingomonas sp. 1P08PE]|uniref:sugar porter family MFS transporter n=1 Tax=Sphingomonas sp. 1P08PE TaxID=554122 RepID=UPI0039A2053C
MGVGSSMGRLLTIAGSAAFGGLMFGFDVAIITGAGPFIERDFHLNPLALGWAFSALLFGCVVGAAAAGPLVERVGRRPTLIAVALIFALTTLATGAASAFAVFVIARFLGGLAVGAVSLAAPMYISEIAPPRYRGRLGALYQMALVTGILVSYLINFGLKDAGADAWRYMFYTGVLPAGVFLLLMLVAPESPRYLVKKGRDGDALAVLASVSGPAQAETDLRAIANSTSGTHRAAVRWTARSVMRPLWVSFCLAILIHLSGVNTVIDYAPRIFASAGLDLHQALLLTIVLGVANFTFTAISFWTIDRFGRRSLYLIGSVGMGLSLTALAGAAMADAFSGPVVLALIILYLLFFASCIGPVFWTLLPEIFPNAVRGAAMTVPVLTQWVANAVVVLFFPAVFDVMGQATTFGFLAVACFGQGLFTFFFLPETRNVALEDMEDLWGRRPGSIDKGVAL